MRESNIEYLSSPINLVGDVHGQFYDVQKLLQIGTSPPIQPPRHPAPPSTRYIFIGDFVDRGYNSL